MPPNSAIRFPKVKVDDQLGEVCQERRATWVRSGIENLRVSNEEDVSCILECIDTKKTEHSKHSIGSPPERSLAVVQASDSAPQTRIKCPIRAIVQARAKIYAKTAQDVCRVPLASRHFQPVTSKDVAARLGTGSAG
jgi:hypothetical protein